MLKSCLSTACTRSRYADDVESLGQVFFVVAKRLTKSPSNGIATNGVTYASRCNHAKPGPLQTVIGQMNDEFLAGRGMFFFEHARDLARRTQPLRASESPIGRVVLRLVILRHGPGVPSVYIEARLWASLSAIPHPESHYSHNAS